MPPRRVPPLTTKSQEEKKLPAPPSIQLCAGCQWPTQKAGGCNLITCTLCKTKWCWRCGLIKGPGGCTNRKHRSH